MHHVNVWPQSLPETHPRSLATGFGKMEHPLQTAVDTLQNEMHNIPPQLDERGRSYQVQRQGCFEISTWRPEVKANVLEAVITGIFQVHGFCKVAYETQIGFIRTVAPNIRVLMCLIDGAPDVHLVSPPIIPRVVALIAGGSLVSYARTLSNFDKSRVTHLMCDGQLDWMSNYDPPDVKNAVAQWLRTFPALEEIVFTKDPRSWSYPFPRAYKTTCVEQEVNITWRMGGTLSQELAPFTRRQH